MGKMTLKVRMRVSFLGGRDVGKTQLAREKPLSESVKKSANIQNQKRTRRRKKKCGTKGVLDQLNGVHGSKSSELCGPT